jgi:hypothetical protein
MISNSLSSSPTQWCEIDGAGAGFLFSFSLTITGPGFSEERQEEEKGEKEEIGGCADPVSSPEFMLPQLDMPPEKEDLVTAVTRGFDAAIEGEGFNCGKSGEHFSASVGGSSTFIFFRAGSSEVEGRRAAPHSESVFRRMSLRSVREDDLKKIEVAAMMAVGVVEDDEEETVHGAVEDEEVKEAGVFEKVVAFFGNWTTSPGRLSSSTSLPLPPR